MAEGNDELKIDKEVKEETGKSIWEAVKNKDVADLHAVLMSDGFDLLTLYATNNNGETALAFAAHTGASECLSLILEFMIGVLCDTCKTCVFQHANVSKIVRFVKCPEKDWTSETEVEHRRRLWQDDYQNSTNATWLETWTARLACMMTCFMKKQRCKNACFSRQLDGSCLKHYINILEFADPLKRTAIFSATYKGEITGVELLVEAGSRTGAVSGNGESVSELAESLGYEDIVNLLMEIPKEESEDILNHLNFEEGATKTFTDLAICADAMKYLSYGTDRPDVKICYLLGIVAQEGDIKLMTSLLEMIKTIPGLRPDSLSVCSCQNHLLIAAKSQNFTADMVDLLLDEGYDPNSIGHNGDTPLMYINGVDLTNCDPELEQDVADRIKRLINAGAEINVRNEEDGDTVLIRNYVFPNLMRQLCFLEAGADVNGVNMEFNSALTIPSTMPRRLEYSKALIEAGADVNHQNHVGETALYEAVVRSDHEVISYLVEQGAFVNHRNKLNETLLMYVAVQEEGDPVLLDLFLEAGADITGEEIYMIFCLNNEAQKMDMLRGLLRRGASPVPVLLSRYPRLNVTIVQPDIHPYSIVTPKIAARLTEDFSIAQFLDDICFDTRFDVHRLMADEKFSEDISLQLLHHNLPSCPCSLRRLCFVIVTANLGRSGTERLNKIDRLPIPKPMKDMLKFKF